MKPAQRCIGYVIVCTPDWEGYGEHFMHEGFSGYDGNREIGFEEWGTPGWICPRVYQAEDVAGAMETAREYWKQIRGKTASESYPIEARPVYM